MKKYNCIVVFDASKENILFCKRTKPPYKGLYNFPGGKVEDGEPGEFAAYRELEEGTGIGKDTIRLFHFMDISYYYQGFVLELYVGQLKKTVELVEKDNPLGWRGINEDYSDPAVYAGEQNISHIVNVAMKFPLGGKRGGCNRSGLCIGVDGCRDGWIAATLQGLKLTIQKYASIRELMREHPAFDSLLIDVIIGLPESRLDERPEQYAKKLVAPRSSVIFSVPSRQAVYEEGKEAQKKANLRTLGKSLAKQALANIPKIREVDEFLLENPMYKNEIMESRPEVCFARLNEAIVRTQKAHFIGQEERVGILSRYLDRVTFEMVHEKAKTLHCNTDDIIDAICLAITANLSLQKKTETLPEEPMMDQRGLLMQMVIPEIREPENE